MGIELWTSPTPNGWKTTIMLEELAEAGVAPPNVRVRTIDLARGEQFSDEFSRHNPNQKIPVLIDGERSIMESCAILHYLGERHPSPLLPADETRWDVLPWVYWQAANVGPAFGNKLSYARYLPDVPDVEKAHPLARFDTEAGRLAGVLDRQLEGRPFVCGEEFTIADIALYPWLRGYKWSKVDITDRSHVMDWIERVRARPGVSRGLAYGVPADEVDRWSRKRKAQYAAGGASIAANEGMKSRVEGAE